MVLTLPIRDVLPATPRARIVRLDLNGTAFPYQPGQALLAGSHGLEKRKPYSIALAPEEAAGKGWLELLVGVDSEGSAGTHLTLARDALVDVEGPIGRFTFPDAPAERRFLFVAGGTGVAPLRAMLHRALTVPHLQIGFLYSARTPDEFAYEAELRSLAEAGDIELRLAATREIAHESWHGTRGRISRADLEPLVHSGETLCFVCGPAPFVEDMLAALLELGVPRERIRIEEWK